MKNIVLFVDDEENILNAIKRAVLADEIVSEEFSALFATSGAEALLLMKKHEISVLVTDMMMPEMDGLSLLKEVKSLYPTTIRIILSGHTQLAQMLAAINQGDIFKFITKPWNMELELFAIVRQGIEYYNLRRDKEILEKSLQQRNLAYKKMLRTLEGKLASKQENNFYLKNFILIILKDLENDLARQDVSSDFKKILKLQLVREITSEYFQALPVVLEEFMVQDIAVEINRYLTQNADEERYKLKIQNNDRRCFGNFKLLLMILLATAKILCRLGGNRTFTHKVTSQVYHDKNVIRINNVIEFGYVDGAKLLIDSAELLSHTNLEFYTALLSQIGQTYDFDVAYTYINQNTSLIAISAEFSLA